MSSKTGNYPREVIQRLYAERVVKPRITPQDFEALVVYEMAEQQQALLAGGDYISPYLVSLVKLGWTFRRKSRRPTRKRDEVKAIVAALLISVTDLTQKEVSERLGFKLTEDACGKFSYSKTGRRYMAYGKNLLQEWSKIGIDFWLDSEGLPEMYIDDIPVAQTQLGGDGIVTLFRNRVRSLYEQVLEKRANFLSKS